MRLTSFMLAIALLAATAFAASAARAEAPIANSGELTQISVESGGQVDVFHLFDLEHALRDGSSMPLTSQTGTPATAKLDDRALMLSLRGFDYRLPLALLPRKTELPVMDGKEDVTIPGREYRMTFARENGGEDVVKVQRRFTGSID